MAAKGKKFIPPPLKGSGFTGKNGYDLMGGPSIKTTPAKKDIRFTPQIGLNLGFDRHP